MVGSRSRVTFDQMTAQVQEILNMSGKMDITPNYCSHTYILYTSSSFQKNYCWTPNSIFLTSQIEETVIYFFKKNGSLH
jgi:hypothetical protein